MTAATMRRDVAAKTRRLADKVQSTHPTMGAHNHLRDAARALEGGRTESAQRHLRAAAGLFTPQTLMRHGYLDDANHMIGKAHMGDAHRMILLVKDTEDVKMQEEGERERKQAMNAPAHMGVGRPDGAAAGPTAPINTVGKRLPAKSWIRAGEQSAGPALMSNTDLAFWQHEARGRHGEWEASGQEKTAAENGQRADKLGHLSAQISDRFFQWGGNPAVSADSVLSAADHMRKGDYHLAISALNDAKNKLNSSNGSQVARSVKEFSREIDKHIAAIQKVAGSKPDERYIRQLERQNNVAVGLAQKAYYVHAGEDVECPFCHKMNEDDAKFCDQCGRKLPASAFEMTAQIYAIAIELSAQTGALAVTPHPFGKPGGPGLWHVKGMELPPYIQNIAHALLRTGRARTVGHAIAIARAATNRWKSGGGHVHPEVRAASQLSDAQWQAKRARAHAHSNTISGQVLDLVGPKGYVHGWHFVGTNTPHAAGYHGMKVIGLTKTERIAGTYDHTKREVVTPEGYRRHVTHIASFQQGNAPAPGTRLAKGYAGGSRSIPKGSQQEFDVAAALMSNTIDLFNPNHGPGGRFTTAGNAQQPKGQQGKGKGQQHKGQHHAPAQHAATHHMSNVQRMKLKGQLLQKARADEAKAAGLRAQLRALLASMRGGGGSGSTKASSGATAAASGATAAASSKTSAAAGGASSKAGSSSSSSSRSTSSNQQKVNALRSQIHALMSAARAAKAQAHAL